MEINLIKRITSKFEAKLATKTSWGRNEIMTTYNQVVQECALEALQTITELKTMELEVAQRNGES